MKIYTYFVKQELYKQRNSYYTEIIKLDTFSNWYVKKQRYLIVPFGSESSVSSRLMCYTSPYIH